MIWRQLVCFFDRLACAHAAASLAAIGDVAAAQRMIQECPSCSC